MADTTIKYDDRNHMMENEFYLMAKVKDETVQRWIRENKLKAIITNVGNVFTKESINKLILTQEYIDERDNFLGSFTQEEIKEIESENGKLVYNIKYYINRIANFHMKYKDNFDLKSKTAELAAYLLFAKAINLSYVIVNSIQNKYLAGFGLFRTLNEAIQLAEYFLIIRNEKKGKKEVTAWFVSNSSPEMRIVRAGSNTYSKKLLTVEIQEIYEANKVLLHNVQSKSVHNTYNDILRLFGFEKDGDKIEYVIEYYKTTNVLELNEYLQYLFSNLITLIVGFQFCFQSLIPILEEADIKELEKMKMEIQEERKKIKKFKITTI